MPTQTRTEVQVVSDLVRACTQCAGGVSLRRGCISCALTPPKEDCPIHVYAGDLQAAVEAKGEGAADNLAATLAKGTTEWIMGSIPPKDAPVTVMTPPQKPLDLAAKAPSGEPPAVDPPKVAEQSQAA